MKTSALTLALAATAYSQNMTNSTMMNLTAAINSNPMLSNLSTYFGPYTAQLANLTNITLLAPNNMAFSEFLNSSSAAALTTEPALVQAILQYHILEGTYQNFSNMSFIPTALQAGVYANVTGGQRVEALGGSNATFFSGLLQNATVVNSTNFTGGVIHVIDRFLTLPQNISASAVALNLTSAAGALTNLSLVNTVDNTRDLTCFIPNNEAFQRIAGNLANLTTANLTSILEYHVVSGVYYSTDLMNDTMLPTLGGENVTIRIDGGKVYANNAQVVIPNVLVRNGVVHVIDRVLNPSNTTAPVNTATADDAFASASSGSDVPFTSGVSAPSSAINTAAATSAQHSATSSGGAWRPMETGAVGLAAIFGGAAAVFNM